MKTLNEYLRLPYRMEIVEDRNEGGFVVSSPDLPGCITCGETVESAVANAQDAKREGISMNHVCICCPKTTPRRQDRPWRWQRLSAFSVMIGSGPCGLGLILWSLLCTVAQTHDGIQENECTKNSCIFESGAVV